MRTFLLPALGAMVLLLPTAHAKEQQDLRARVRDGVQRTDKDLGACVHRDKLNPQQQERLDSAVKDLHDIRDAVTGGQWEGDRALLVRAADNIDYLVKNAAIEDSDKQTLGIDVYTLRSILDAWKP